MQYLLTIVVFFSCCHTTFGQHHDVLISGWSVGVTPSALVNSFAGAQVTVRYGPSDYIQMGVEAAYLLSDDGFRIRGNVRGFPFSGRKERWYLGAGYHYRSVTWTQSRWIDRFGGQYQERVTYQRKRDFSGTPFIIGLITAITDRIHFDVGIGMGPGLVDISVSGLPEDVSPAQLEVEEFFRVERLGRTPVLLGYVHFALTYRL